MKDPVNRREVIAGAAAAAAGASLYALLRGGPSDTEAAAPNCVLAPEQTEGPYYVNNHLIRSDIRSGKRGAPLLLKLQVLDVSTCKPIKGATVEVWHADAIGEYSGFTTPGNYLRGGQRSNSGGNVSFRTVYPGWYQ